MPQLFDQIEDALEYAVGRLVPKRHGFIINVRGPTEISKSRAATIQVIAEYMVYKEGELGLTIHLPFDASSGEFRHLVEFVGADLDSQFDEYNWSGIPCFALSVGTDVVMAEKVLRFVLQRVYGYVNLDGFVYEVYDEGPMTQ